jgi:hypothetical protein
MSHGGQQARVGPPRDEVAAQLGSPVEWAKGFAWCGRMGGAAGEIGGELPTLLPCQLPAPPCSRP